MATRWLAGARVPAAALLAAALLTVFLSWSDRSGEGAGTPPPAPPAGAAPQPSDDRPSGSRNPPDFDLMLRQQAETDQIWRDASAGRMRMAKIAYRTRLGDLDIPAFVFEPLHLQGPGAHPALVWVHENIRGRVYEHYIPYVLEATRRGYVVIAPEYRGSIGYGQAFYDAIDYGGAEVDDVVTAVDVLGRYAHVDRDRVGVIGWSHGGMIALLAVARNPGTFRAVAAIAPVVNLFYRIDRTASQRQAIDPHDRFGGSPAERPDVYRARSPLFHVDKLDVPVLVHFARNDGDVTIREGMQFVRALREQKPELAEITIYRRPPGGHMFDRRVNPRTWEPENTPEQIDSWARVWAFFEARLAPKVPALTEAGAGQ